MPERTIMRWEPVLQRDQPRGELDLTWRWKVVVGRSRDCDVVLKHGSIPEKHGQFARLRNVWWVEDYRSVNGIYMGGKRIHMVPVRDEPVDFAMMVRFRLETVPMPAEELRFREAIYAAPSEDARFLVYADWLQERGDELGQLMVSPAPIAARWLGMLHSPGIEVKWRHGFLDTVKVRSALGIVGKRGVFEEVLTHPLSVFLRGLEADAVLLAAETDHISPETWAADLFEAVLSNRPKTLRTLKVRMPSENRLSLKASFEELKARLPGLETDWDSAFSEGALA